MTNIKTYLILFGGVFALSTSAIFVKIAQAPSAVIAFYRLLIAGLILFPFLLLRSESRAEAKALTKKQWTQIIFAGLFLALHYVMWFESLRYTSIASSTVIVCLQPLFSLAPGSGCSSLRDGAHLVVKMQVQGPRSPLCITVSQLSCLQSISRSK